MKNRAETGPDILLSTGCLFHLPLPTIADLAARAGFDGLEVIVSSPRIEPGEKMDAVDALCPVRSLHAPFRQWSKWGGHLNSWKETVRLANSLDRCDNVTLHPPGATVAETIRSRWFAKATDLNELLDAKGRVDLSLENLPWAAGSPFSRDPLGRLVEQCRRKKLGMTFDVCHMGVSGRDVLEALSSVPLEIIRNVHFSDSRGLQEHLPPGKGELPLGAFLGLLANAGYSRYLTLELEPAAFPEDMDGTLEALTDHRRWIKEHLQ